MAGHSRPLSSKQGKPTLDIVSTANGRVIHREILEGEAASLAVSDDSTRLAVGTRSVRVLDCVAWRFLSGDEGRAVVWLMDSGLTA